MKDTGKEFSEQPNQSGFKRPPGQDFTTLHGVGTSTDAGRWVPLEKEEEKILNIQVL